ncbi:hypothetical protein VKT23_015929 [Stygiomarasmius scandens]|uniref:C2H2-type domain-containing protein n=1 Tax=Marasmiellus scandens TaxID=2682957 RepID=A0ABR1IWD3_9AGAR
MIERSVNLNDVSGYPGNSVTSRISAPTAGSSDNPIVVEDYYPPYFFQLDPDTDDSNSSSSFDSESDCSTSSKPFHPDSLLWLSTLDSNIQSRQDLRQAPVSVTATTGNSSGLNNVSIDSSTILQGPQVSPVPDFSLSDASALIADCRPDEVPDIPWKFYARDTPMSVLAKWVSEQKLLRSKGSLERPEENCLGEDGDVSDYEQDHDDGVELDVEEERGEVQSESKILEEYQSHTDFGVERTEQDEEARAETICEDYQPAHIEVEESEYDTARTQTSTRRRKRLSNDSDDEADEYTPTPPRYRPIKRRRVQLPLPFLASKKSMASSASRKSCPVSVPRPRNIQHPNPEELLEQLSQESVVSSWTRCPAAFLGCTHSRGRSLAEFKRHVMSHAYAASQWTCHDCGIKMSRKDALLRHLRDKKCKKI